MTALEQSACDRCGGTGWVCENHPDRPWRGFSNRADACDCTGAGAPCGLCNTADPPDMSRTGMKVTVDKDGWRQ
jgi:hypothetical protein